MKNVKFPQKIMVWGAISVNVTSRLHIVDDTMNQDMYITVLETRLLAQIREWYGESPCIFQQDSASCHTAKKVKTWCKQNYVQLSPWAGNSPDMNPIQSLWNELKDETHQVPVTNKNSAH